MVARDEYLLWMELKLPASVDHAFIAFTSDLLRAITALLDRADQAGGKLLLQLGLEAGIVYTTAHGQINEESVLRRVDALLDLLDRIPGARPRYPAATV